MTCPRCEANENLNDYPVCPTCATVAHFTNREARGECRCAGCAAKPVVEIKRVPRGTYDFATPHRSEAFLDEFKMRIGKPFRFWNLKGCWQITPLDRGMLELIAELLRKHYAGCRVVIVDESAAAMAA
jgi:hypothetical protein